jgi:exonuclease VII large subunit
MHQSVAKLDSIRERINREMTSFEEEESEAIQDAQKRQHYEKIRISEETKERQEDLEQVSSALEEVDKQVYEDTKE